MKCACGNDARYITEQGLFTCSLCPLRQGIEAIRLTDVGPLLPLLRELMRQIDHHDGPQRDLEMRRMASEIRVVLGRNPRGGQQL